MSKLFTFGCSLTSFRGKKEKLSSLLKLENIDLSCIAGSNQLQIKRLIELLVNNQIKSDDIVYWQITYMHRNYARLNIGHRKGVEKHQKMKMYKGHQPHYEVSKFKNLFDKNERYDLLSHSRFFSTHTDGCDDTQTLLGIIILLKKYCPKILVSFGWRDVLPGEYMDIFKHKLKINNIDYIDECFLEFAKDNHLGLMDDMHPDAEASAVYAEEIIFKKMKDLKWID